MFGGAGLGYRSGRHGELRAAPGFPSGRSFSGNFAVTDAAGTALLRSRRPGGFAPRGRRRLSHFGRRGRQPPQLPPGRAARDCAATCSAFASKISLKICAAAEEAPGAEVGQSFVVYFLLKGQKHDSNFAA